MTHADFVRGYRQGRLGVRINKAFALSSLGESRSARRFQWLNMAWAAGGLGGLVLLIGAALPHQFRKSASRSLLEQAVEDGRFFDEVRDSNVLSVTYRYGRRLPSSGSSLERAVHGRRKC